MANPSKTKGPKLLGKNFNRDLLSKAEAAKPVLVSTGLIFGDISTHKTRLLCSASEYFPPESVVIVSCNRYDETLASFPKVKAIDLLGLDGDIKDNMRSIITEIRQYADCPIRFLGIDMISSLSDVLRARYRQERLEKRSDDFDGYTQQDYLKTQNTIIELIYDLRTVCVERGVHLWLTAREKIEYRENDDGSTREYAIPDLPPGLGNVLRHEMSFCGRARIAISKKGGVTQGKISVTSEGVPKISFGVSLNAPTKNRMGLPDEMEWPTVEAILKDRYFMPSETDNETETETETEIIGAN